MSAAATMSQPYSTAIDSLAHQLGEAMSAATQHHGVLSAAEKHRDGIAARIAALFAERAAIVSRRAGGKQDTDDGSKLALLSADLEGLAAMQPDAVHRVTVAKSAFDAATNSAAQLREEIAKAEATALREALIPHVSDLAEKLTAAIKALAESSKRAGIGGKPPWGSSRELRDMLRALAAQRGEL